MTTRDRFLIHTALDPASLLNATLDDNGRPGFISNLLPPESKIVSVVSLPVGDLHESYPEAFRLLIIYRQKVATWSSDRGTFHD